MEGYKLDKTMLGDEEIESIMMSVGAMSATGYSGVDNVVDKISSIFKNHKPDDWVDVDFTEWDSAKSPDSSFQKIKTAILERRWVRLSYFSAYGQRTERKLAPLKLMFKSRSWYVPSYCAEKKDTRLFKLSRMRDIELTDERFEREKYLKIQQKPKEKSPHFEIVHLKMRFRPEAAYLLYDWYAEENIKKQADGTYLVTARFPMDEWVYSHILSYGDNVEVLEPEYVREEIKKRLRDILSTYENETR
jgi:predicted DNA-binding transcriptional regulator YafY